MAKKCYFGCIEGENTGIAVVAEDLKQAKKFLWHVLSQDYGGEDYIDMRVRMMRNARIQDLPVGHVFMSEEELQDGVERGAYGYLEEGGICKRCGKSGYVEHINEPPYAVCMECPTVAPPSSGNTDGGDC